MEGNNETRETGDLDEQPDELAAKIGKLTTEDVGKLIRIINQELTVNVPAEE